MDRKTLDAVLGNEALLSRIGADLREGTLSHAYIIEGPHGVGKRTLARELCAALACTGDRGERLPCGRCLPCQKVRVGNCPDIITIKRTEKASIGVNEVRFLRADVLVRPNDLDYKIYIIEEADTLTEEAQNALLLTLEEPPSYVLFLLLCRRSAALLETVRSRSTLLRMSPLPTDTVEAYLASNERTWRELSAEDRAQVLLIADGCIGRAKELLSAKERKPILERRALAAALVERSLRGQDAFGTLSLFAPFRQKRDDVLPVLAEALTALRDLALLKRAENVPLCFYTDREAATALCDRATMKAILALCEGIEKARTALYRGANVRLVLTSLLLP